MDKPNQIQEGITAHAEDLWSDFEFQQKVKPLRDKIVHFCQLDHDGYEVLSAGLARIQDDTVTEFEAALRVVGADIESVPEAGAGEFYARVGAFLLIANACNMGDGAFESYKADNPVIGESVDIQTLLYAPLIKLRDRGFNTYDMLTLAATILTTSGLECPDIMAEMEGVIQAEVDSLGLLMKGGYTTQEGIEYRHKTIGKYAKLLGRVISNDKSKQDEFVKVMMGIQWLDDLTDINEDAERRPQVNPFIPILRTHGLIGWVDSVNFFELYFAAVQFKEDGGDFAEFELQSFGLPEGLQLDLAEFVDEITATVDKIKEFDRTP